MLDTNPTPTLDSKPALVEIRQVSSFNILNLPTDANIIHNGERNTSIDCHTDLIVNDICFDLHSIFDVDTLEGDGTTMLNVNHIKVFAPTGARTDQSKVLLKVTDSAQVEILTRLKDALKKHKYITIAEDSDNPFL